MLKNLVGSSPRSERAGKSPCAAARKLRAVVESLEGRTMMSVALMSVAVSGVADRLIPIPAEATTVTSSRVTSNLASPDAPTPTKQISLNFDMPLRPKINDLLSKSMDSYFYRKGLLLDSALEHYHQLFGTYTSKMKAYQLANPNLYYISTGKPPTYFNDTLKYISPPAGSITVTYATSTYYDYNNAHPHQFWVDFANKKLGGGVFDTGFLQEETMFLETPELANAAALGSLLTRTGRAGPLHGSPTPLIFVGANRVMNIDSKWMVEHHTPGSQQREDENWRSKAVPVGDVLQHDVPLKTAQNINVLSMAAPYLPDTPGGKADLPVVWDLFNTFDAGFTLATTAYPGKPILINTGRIGAGGFHNSPVVVNVMQQLAAIVVSQQIGSQVNLKFWGYQNTKTEATEADDDVKAIIATFNKDTDKSISHLLEVATLQMGGKLK